MTRPKKRPLDFSNVKERGNFKPKRMLAGDYRAVITEVSEEESQSSGEDMWVYKIELTVDPTATYPMYCVLNEDNLWKLRNLFVAAGVEVPKRRLNVDPERVIDAEIGITLEDDEYNEREKSTIADMFPAEDLGDSDAPDGWDSSGEEEEEKPRRNSRTKRTAPATKGRTRSRGAATEEPEPDDDDEPEDADERPARNTRRTAKSSGSSRTTTTRRKSSRRAADDDVDDAETEALDLDEL